MQSQHYLRESADIAIPRIIYGTAWKKQRTADLVEQAIKNGFRGIDTACQPKHYDEGLVGEGIQRAIATGIKRESLYIQTKFTSIEGQDPKNIPYDKSAPLAEQVAQSFAVSKRNLQTEYLDCWILHSPMRTHARTMEAWRAMEAIVRQGGVNRLGISNCYDVSIFNALYQAAEIKPAVLQNRFYDETEYDKRLRQICTDRGITYQSFWTLTANPHLLQNARIIKLAKEYGKSEAQLFFRYLTQQGIVPLTGTCSEEHMREDLAIFDFELSAQEQNDISQLLV